MFDVKKDKVVQYVLDDEYLTALLGELIRNQELAGIPTMTLSKFYSKFQIKKDAFSLQEAMNFFSECGILEDKVDEKGEVVNFTSKKGKPYPQKTINQEWFEYLKENFPVTIPKSKYGEDFKKFLHKTDD